MKLEKGKKAATPKGISHNVKVMEKRESSTKKAVIKHLKDDNKDCAKETKTHNKLIRKMK